MFSLKDITVGHYVNTRSVVHRLDPRTKCAAVILLMAAVIVAKSAYFYILVTVGCFALTLIAELPWAMVVRNLRAFIWLFAITFGIHLFFTPGTPLTPFPIKGVTITSEGLEMGLFFSYRLALLIVSAALFTLTTSPTELTDGIERMLKPLRRLGLPVHESSTGQRGTLLRGTSETCQGTYSAHASSPSVRFSASRRAGRGNGCSVLSWWKRSNALP